MGVFSGFGGWINQSIQHSLNADKSKRPENVQSNSVTENDANKAPSKVNKIYYDKKEELRQFQLWRIAEKKHPWYDPPPKVKVTTKNGICHMHIELTMGTTPYGAYEFLTQPDGLFFDINESGRQLLANKSIKVLKENGPRQIVKLEKAVAWDFLWWSGEFPFSLIVDENKKDLTGKYKKEKMMFMKVFEGKWKVEPIYVDQERLCKHNLPKSVEEYKKCSGGQGKVASKVIMDHYFQPYRLLDLPPVSWYIRETTIRITTILLQMLQNNTAVLRGIDDKLGNIQA